MLYDLHILTSPLARPKPSCALPPMLQRRQRDPHSLTVLIVDRQVVDPQRRFIMRPTRIPTLTATAIVASGRCSTSCERRRSVWVPIFAASPLSLAASPLKCAPPRNRSATLLRAAARISPRRSAASPVLAETRPLPLQGLLKEAQP